MEDYLIEGSRALKAINIDLNYPGVDVNVDFLHIDHYKPSEEYSLHAHPNFEFHYIAEGEGEVGFIDTLNINSSDIFEVPAIVKSIRTPKVSEYHLKKIREQEVLKNTKVFKLKKGDAFMNPPGQFCWQKSSEENPMIEYGMRFTFSIKGTESPVNKYFIKEYKSIHQLLSQNIIQITHDNDDIRHIFESIFKEAYQKLPGFISKIKNDFLNLIILYARQCWDNTHIDYYVPELDLSAKRLLMIDSFIRSNLGNPIKVSQLAKNVYMSERSLSRFIKDHKGVSVHQYVLQQRINKAVELCVNPDYTLTDVANLTGFSSPFHLSKAIKQFTGKNPSEL
jgi:AraC-like DNA-binding protein